MRANLVIFHFRFFFSGVNNSLCDHGSCPFFCHHRPKLSDLPCGDHHHHCHYCYHCYCKSLPFFYCLNFEKADCPIFAHLVGRRHHYFFHFNIYRHKSPLLTQYHSIPISTKLYWPSITKLQPVSPHTDPVPPSYKQYRPILTQYHQIPTNTALYRPSTLIYHDGHCNNVHWS